MGDNLVAFQESRGGPTNKRCSSTPPSQDNCNEGMQPSLGVDERDNL